MKTKKTFYSEAAYVLGIVFLAFGTALMERADFGVSMVVAPAYVLHLKISQYIPAFTFGMAEYVLQAVLLILMIIILRNFKLKYVFSFVTALLYGAALDLNIAMISGWPLFGIAGRIAYYSVGMLFCVVAIAMLFKTYISPEVYELFVKEVSLKFHLDINKTKTTYDCVSCLVAILLSFLFFGFGSFEGVKVGTVVCAFINGFLIGVSGKVLEACFEFKDAFKLRKLFDGEYTP